MSVLKSITNVTFRPENKKKRFYLYYFILRYLLDLRLFINLLKSIKMKKLPLPESQTQEVLFELIKRLSIDRKTMMLSCGVANLTAQISILGNKGVKIITEEVPFQNKYGRKSSFAQYKLESKSDAVTVYHELKANQRKKICSHTFYDFDTCEVKEKIGCLDCD